MQRPSISNRPLDLIALCALIVSGLATGTMYAQSRSSTLPATPPLTSQLQSSTQPATAPAYGTSTEHPAVVTYSDGRLSVTANDSSLNQILRAISRATGMKITGGVVDERVFGAYGPDTPSRVLSALLNGTSSNMLIIQGSHTGNTTAGTAAPIELVLTPRNGGPTPPNPNPQPFGNNAGIHQSTPTQSTPTPPTYPIAEPPPPPTPAIAPGPGAASTNAGVPSGASSTDSTQQQSPNGVKTPQQIYEQLQQLRQLQQQQQTQQTRQ